MEKEYRCPFCGRSDEITTLAGKAFCFSCRNLFDLNAGDIRIPDYLKLKTDWPVNLFLSYPHSSFYVCGKIFLALKLRGHNVWFDRDRLQHGMDWRLEIASEIEKSDAVLSCLSEDAVRVVNGIRGVCLDELSIAISVKGGNIKTILLEPENVVKPTAALAHRQWLDMSEWKEKKEAGEDTFNAWFDRMMVSVISMIENRETYEFDGEIREVRRLLEQTDFSLSKRYLLREPYFGRKWLAEKVNAWLNDTREKPLCVLYADPGVGKSAFAVHYAFEDERAAAIICFDSKYVNYNRPGMVIRSIAYQLSCRLSDYRKALLKELRKTSISQLSSAEMFDRLLIRPLGEAHCDGNHEMLCIILDGLDECTAGEENAVAEVIAACVDRFPRFLRLLVTSRRETAVLERLSPDEVISLTGRERENMEDLHEYLMEELKDAVPDEFRRKKLAEAIADRSEGSFLYADLVADMIRQGKADAWQPDGLPDKLSKAVYQWFGRLFPDKQEYNRVYCLAVGAILASSSPLPQEELELLLGMPEKEQWELVRRLRMFLSLENDPFGKPGIMITHRYIRDWLESPEAGQFRVTRKEAVRKTALAMYRRLLENRLTGYELLHIREMLQEAEYAAELEKVKISPQMWNTAWKLAEECRKQGIYSTAVQLYQVGIETVECRIRTRPGDKNDLRAAAQGYGMTAVLYCDMEQYETALERSMKSWTIMNDLVSETDDPVCTLELAVCCEQISRIMCRIGQFDEAIEYARQAVVIGGKVVSETGEPRYIQSLSTAYGVLEEALSAAGRNAETDETLRRKLDLTEHLAANQGSAKDLMRLADAREKKKEPDEVLRGLYEAALAAAEAESGGNGQENDPEALRTLADACMGTGKLYQRLGLENEAEALFARACSVMERVVSMRGDFYDEVHLATAYGHYGKVLEARKEYQSALEYYEKCLEIRKRQVQKRGTPLDYNLLANAFRTIGNCLEKQEKPQEAVQYYQNAISVLEELTEENKSFNYLELLATYYMDMSTCLKKGEKRETALAYCRKERQIRQYIVDHRGEEKDKKALVRARTGLILVLRSLFHESIMLAEELKKKDKPDDAEVSYRRALDYAAQLLEEDDCTDHRRRAATVHYLYGLFLRAKGGQPEKAEEHLKMALEMAEEVYAADPAFESSYRTIKRMAED